MRKILRVWKLFSSLPLKFAIRTWFCYCPQYLGAFHIVFECIPSIHDQRKDVGSPKSTSLFSTFHIGSMFCFFPSNFMSSTCTDQNNSLFDGVRTGIPNWKPSPSHTSMEFSQIAFPIIVLLKDDHTDSAQEERLGLQYWTMILAI